MDGVGGNTGHLYKCQSYETAILLQLRLIGKSAPDVIRSKDDKYCVTNYKQWSFSPQGHYKNYPKVRFEFLTSIDKTKVSFCITTKIVGGLNCVALLA